VQVLPQQERIRVVLRDRAGKLLAAMQPVEIERCRPVRRLDSDRDDEIATRDQLDAQELALFDRLCGRGGAGHQSEQQPLPQRGPVFLNLVAQPLQRAALGSFLIQLGCGLAQHLVQVLHGHGLEQVFQDAQLDGLLRVLELIMTAEDDDLGGRQAIPDDLAELQAVHERHANVGDQEIGLGRPEERQGDLTVWGFAAELEAAGLPVYIIPDPLANLDLVLDEKDLVRHRRSSSSLNRDVKGYAVHSLPV